jgi:DNA-binding transcriptional LysR family regulator
MVNLDRLQHFVALSHSRSFVRAAETLGITQPALSRSIQALEATYALRLFNRSRGGVVLTAAGEVLLDEATRLIQEARIFEFNACQLGVGKVGRVSFGLGPIVTSAFLSKLFVHVIQEQPGIQLDAVTGRAEDLVKRTLAGELEFACCSDFVVPLADSNEATRVVRLPIVRLVRAGHPLSKGKGRIDEFPTIVGGTLDEHMFYERRVVCNDFNVAKAVTLGSDAIWMTARATAIDEIKKKKLVQLPPLPDDKDMETRIVIIQRRARTLAPATHYVMETLRKLISSERPV